MIDAIQHVSSEAGQRLIDEEGYAYLDVRTAAEYAAGHPVGAYNVPVMLAGPGGMRPNARFLEVMDARFGKGAKLVVGCRSGGRSTRAVKLLLEAGYTQVVDMRPGYVGLRNAFGQVTEPGWEACGFPTERETEGRSYADLAD